MSEWYCYHSRSSLQKLIIGRPLIRNQSDSDVEIGAFDFADVHALASTATD